MAIDSPFAAAASYHPEGVREYRGAVLPVRFGPPADEYRAAHTGVVMFDRSERGLLVLTGADRATWLHNLVTNTVKTLEPNTGNYAFATDVKGRVQFDANTLVLTDQVWLDVDREALPGIVAHLSRYRIIEDVQIQDATSEHARLGCTGPEAVRVATALGVSNFTALPALASVALLEADMRLVRHDFAGMPGFELVLPAARAAEIWDRMVEAGARPAGFAVLDALRVEAGIPWFGRDIDDQVIPPETGHVERGISYHKGCYIGQEVMERMRARGILARRLVRLSAPPNGELSLPAEMRSGDSVVGRVTSLVPHPTEQRRIGLGYLKTAVEPTAALVAGDPPIAISVVP